MTPLAYWGPFNWGDWDSRILAPARPEVANLVNQHRPPLHELHQRNGSFGVECLYCAKCELVVWSVDETEPGDVHSW